MAAGETRAGVGRARGCAGAGSRVTTYLGGANVTSSSYGFALAAGQSISFDLTAKDVLYAAVAAGTSPLNVLHLGI